MGAIPPVVSVLIADTKEYTAKMTEAQAKMGEFGKSSETVGAKMAGFASTASTAVLGIGAALGGYAVDQAYKFQEAMDHLKNQAGLSDSQLKVLGNSIQNTSAQTGVSTNDLATAAISVEQAGIRGKNAMDLLNAAAQAAVVTNSSVANTTQAVIGAQKLRITSGMTMADVMGTLVQGSKNFVGGMQAETNMLSGRVGVSLANYGLKLKTLIPLGQVFAQVGLPSRSVASFAAGLGKLDAPLTTIVRTTKGSHEAVSTYAKNLEMVGLSATHLQAMLRGGDIVGILSDIKNQAIASHLPLSELVNLVFGTGGGATASVLVKNLEALKTATKGLSGAGAGSLSSGFKEAIKQLGPQFKILMAQVDILMQKAGAFLLPKLSTALTWANSLISYFHQHPLVSTLAMQGAAVALGAALTVKMAGLGIGIAEGFGMAFTGGAALRWGGYLALGFASYLGTMDFLNWLKGKATIHPSAKLGAGSLPLASAEAAAGITNQATIVPGKGTTNYLAHKHKTLTVKNTVKVK